MSDPSRYADFGGERFVRDQRQDLPNLATKENCQGKTFIVTGANTGLGYEAAKHLVGASPAKVILASRSIEKGEAAKSKIEADTGVKNVAEVWELDMGSFESIKAFAAKVNKLERVDAIVENAGVAPVDWSTRDGYEETLMVNDLGTVLLAVLVLPKLKESAKKFGNKPHLTIVGSGILVRAPGVLEAIGGDIVDELNDKDRAKMEERYPVSKLLEMYAVREFAGLHPVSESGVVINYVSPGLCITELTRSYAPEARAYFDDMQADVGRTAEMGARTLVHGALGGEETHGKYVSECEAKQRYLPSWITDDSGQKIQKQVWKSLSNHLNRVVPNLL